MNAPDRSFLPTATLDMLRRRAELLARMRHFFAVRDFLEVETPILSHDVVVDRHLDPLGVTLFRDPREPTRGQPLWLQTSPEFGMKRLLAAGATAIFQITKVFRGGEVGRLHNPEFTLVEWYRVGDDYAAGRRLLGELAAEILGRGPPDELTFATAFHRHAGVDPHGLDDFVIDELLTSQVDPHLGRGRPTILFDYPASQAALAQVRPGPPAVAERFELYVDGIELANGYHELLDPAILRERNRTNNAARISDGKPALPAESRLLAAMEQGLPPCSGCALGFDRLVMVATGAKSIAEVLAFPMERA
ncbi:MAG: amino acid--tRNA ligase-related protein [Pirellulaceae bacterium]|nr:amino acid--tRNA ligase-related protein [Pirellulaceae bacterium]